MSATQPNEDNNSSMQIPSKSRAISEWSPFRILRDVKHFFLNNKK